LSEARHHGAGKWLPVTHRARVAAIVPAHTASGDAGFAFPFAFAGGRLLASHDGVETHQVAFRGAFVTFRTVILAVDSSSGVGFIERVAHRASLESFAFWLLRATHLARFAAVRLLGSGPHLSREAVVRLGTVAVGGTLASSAVLKNGTEGLLLGATIHLSAIHLGASEFLAVFDDAVIATIKPVFATLRELALASVARAFEFGVNIQKLFQSHFFLVVTCCLLKLRFGEFAVQLRKSTVDTTGCQISFVI